MINILKLNIDFIENIIDLLDISQLDYHEYKFLNRDKLKSYYKAILNSYLKFENNYFFIAICHSNPIGFICARKDLFDSKIFGFDCFKLDIKVFSNNLNEINSITNLLLNYFEDYIRNITNKYYFLISLNTNTYNNIYILNNLLSNNYFLINTLLTFSSESFSKNISFYNVKDLIIREAKRPDAEQVSILAQKSFNKTRFHLDPFLDDGKANNLIKTSAYNSIVNKFADIMFVAEINNVVVGYYCAKKLYISEFNKSIGHAIISAVDSKYRGLGIFNKLDDHILNWFNKNTDFAEMGTYIINFPVYQTWINKKLKLVRGVHQLSKIHL